MKNSKRIVYWTIALAMVMLLGFSGCGNKTASDKTGSSSQSTSKTLEEVTLTWYELYFTGIPSDMEIVNDEINKYTMEKIRAKVDIKATPFGDFEKRMSLIIASGEKFDICFTSSWVNNFVRNVAKGAYLPLDDYLKNTPKLKETLPEVAWNATTINGKIYGVVNQQIFAWADGFGFMKELVDKYNFDINSVKKYEDIEPFLKAVKENEKDMIPICARFLLTHQIGGYGPIMSPYTPGAVKIEETEKFKVVNQWETPEYKAWFETNGDSYLKGYIQEDAVSIKDISALSRAGKYAVMPDGVIKPGGDIEGAGPNFGGKEVVQIAYTDRYVTNDSIYGTLMAVSKTSTNPERAVMLLEMLSTDPKLINLVSFGIEDIHYKKTSDTQIEAVKDSKYNPNQTWAFGNSLLAYALSTQNPKLSEEVINLNMTGKASSILGFVFDSEPVKAQIANCASVTDKYLQGLWTGAIDTHIYLPKMLDELKKAGSDAIIAEMQKQLDAWVKTK